MRKLFSPARRFVYHDYAGRWDCTEWQHADFNYADELAKGHRRRSDRFTGTFAFSLFSTRATIPVERRPMTFSPERDRLAHPSAWPILIVTDGVGWVQQWGGPVQVIRKGDIVWIPLRQALACATPTTP